MSTTIISATTSVLTPSSQPVENTKYPVEASILLYDQNGFTVQLDTSDWLHDPLEAMARDLGPYTVVDMEMYLDNDYAVELYNGWVVWRPMTDTDERIVVSTIQGMLDISARKAGFGQAMPDKTECRLDEGNDIMPDAALVSWQRLEEDVMLHGPNQRSLLIKCPELIVEARSPSNWRKQERLKRDMYFAHGTLIVWDVDEKNKRISVYRAENPATPTVYGLDDIIDCEPLLPGWKRRVADIFDKQASAEAVIGEVAEEIRQEGVQEGIVSVAQNMLRQEMDLALIASLTGLSEESIRAIHLKLSAEK